ncbi:PREDICTED: transmembrane protein 154 isoform X2 [Gekko japonicus]|uniref:Transmembrane protein 154 isoform X2 n=1 Tax=Gekko japonicus TaxID=146911 RepID=A0ABM1JSU3_GEKJA|nr:PREDICTED: transmembrane protein 154 isoform X2 [Gekko japonicus]
MDLRFKLQTQGFDTVLAEPESSGMLPTVQVTLGHSTTIVLLTSGNPDLQTATSLTETGTAATTKIEDMNNHENEGLHPVLIFGVPAALVLVLLVLLIFFVVRCRKQKQLKQEELGSENCKSPIFEEDTPSVMEIEMEELDKWMNSLKRNVECEYLSPVKEEKDLNANTSDCES